MAVALERLDAAGAAAAEGRLAGILMACVAEGAAVTFLHPLPEAEALAFWREVTADLAAGRRLLLVAREAGRIVGTVQLWLGTPANQRHRAELAKLLVAPEARRRGIGRALMLRAEAEALAAGRTLLSLDTRQGDAGEALYRSLGWRELGVIPGYARNGDGSLHAAAFFWKALG